MPVVYCLVVQTRRCVVLGEQLGLGGSCLWKPLLEHPGDAGMELLASGFEERLVGNVLHHGVLEGVNGIRRDAVAEDQLRSDQLVETRAQLILGPVGDRGEQRMGKLAADHRPELRHLLHRGEAVEPRHQRIVQRCRNRERRQRARKFVVIARVGQKTGFHHRLGQLLDEQRRAIGLGHDLRDNFGR